MRRIRHPLFAGVGALSLLATSACGLAGRVTGQEPPVADPVRLAVPEWPGGLANVAVAEYVLENELGIPVEKVYVPQNRAWDQLADGDVDAILEDWGALPELRDTYVERRMTAVDGGPLGITGHVGWYVAGDAEFAADHPDALNWRNLGEYTDELGGELLHGDPLFTTRDDDIIADLDLDLTSVAAGSEDALVAEIAAAGAAGRPVLTYLWQPHWLAAETELSEVELPGYYPRIELRKYLNAEFSEDGGPAADFLRAFSWGEADQNEVAELIAGEGLSPGAAAERWVTDHPDEVAAWTDGL
ncbi:glycine betaine ABC transporter substrate-binding protein [Streptomyces avicenniae]|uniref:glycine betaine ABC transporter substrate-binding protein n=1 Tax=Streptomyces avicenniae TaxID=500153 RepID=UPI00069AC636|nr:glycine betaine ABC transporter substrate-binding protein [Streptomyces avicenniae]